MPLPILWLVGAACGAGLSVWAMKRVRAKKYRLAVLGARRTGKTTLINSWRGTWVTDAGHTQASEVPTTTKLTVEGLRLNFTVGDVSGDVHAWPTWADRVQESRYVLYLVDARMLAGVRMPHDADPMRVRDDLGVLGRHWLGESRVHLCVLVVTHTDEDPRDPQDRVTAGYRKLVTDQLSEYILLLGGESKVRVAVGSLRDQASAHLLTQDIVNHIILFEKDYKA